MKTVITLTENENQAVEYKIEGNMNPITIIGHLSILLNDYIERFKDASPNKKEEKGQTE